MSRGLVEIIGSIFAGRRKSEDQPPPVEFKLPGEGDFASIYSRNPHSSILANVLTDAAEPGLPGGTPIPDSRPAPLSKTVGIGEELRKTRETLLASGEKLAGVSDAATAEYVNSLLALAEAQHCSIAFIGQMNAGKSSLINAFVGAPKLLPTEITPWTTVVTNLYFGMPRQPTSGALFEFFSQSEWQQLAEGSARVRALTERLVPNFPWEDFYRQVGNMREKAEEKLGERYGELLGTQHAVPVVTLDVLEKYIAAESPLGDEDGSSAGEFSMITKAAHLYFDLASFFYPTVVIDTPGINDPFLVRDEITRQNLERANVFVIVVTARQPLSNADLDLLRILRGLRKDNIVIFVNKADELGDEAGHASAIMDRIRVLLKKEFPGTDIPIIMGSARWAEIAMEDDIAEKRELAETAGVDAPRAATGEAEEKGFWISSADIEDTLLTDGILMRSGVADLALAVSEMLGTGPVAGSITYTASVLAAVTRNSAARAAENAALAERLVAGGDEGQAARIEQASGILADVEGRIGALEEGFETVLRDQGAMMLERLNAKVTACIAEWQSAGGKPASGGLSVLVVRLRSALEQEFGTLFQDALHQITARSQETGEALREQLAVAGEALHVAIECPELPAVKSSPSQAALGEPVATDVGTLAQGRWGGAMSASEKAEAMQSIIAGEFEAIVASLTKSAEQELKRSSGFILDQMRVTVSQALRAAIDEQRNVLAMAESLGADAVRNLAQVERDKAEMLAGLVEGLAPQPGA
jgi:GTP-binding protein EngB required for normal cell division